MRNDSTHNLTVSDLTLERFELGELPAAELRALKSRLEGDVGLRERLIALRESNASILRETSPEVFKRRLQARLRKHEAEKALRETGPRTETAARHSTRQWSPLLGSLALLALVMVPTVLLAPRLLQNGQGVSEAPEETVRIKGLQPRLAVFRKTDLGAEPLHPGEKARPGEFLRIGYNAGGFAYGAIFSVDGNGSVTRHWPEDGDRAGRLAKGEALLPTAFELDAAPDYERFYFVVSEKPFALDPVQERLDLNNALPDTLEKSRVVRFEVLKENRKNRI